jgi:hypothetical protein
MADALFTPGALAIPLLGRLPLPTHPGAVAQPIPGHTSGAYITLRDNAIVASRDTNGASVTSRNNAVFASHDNDPATPTRPDTLAQPIPGHTTPTLSDGESATPCDNAGVASRHKNGASVTSRDNAVVASRDNDPATPTHPDVLAQHCPATLPLAPLVKRLSLCVTTLLSLCATTRRLSLRTPFFGGNLIFLRARTR